jgi:rod shape-determining protein MreC
MTAILTTPTARRRAVAFSVLVAVTLLLMAISSSPVVRELQNGFGFAFKPIRAAVDGVAATVSDAAEAIAEIDRLRRDNDSLAAENERLRNENSRLGAVRRENDQLTALLQLRSGLDHETVAARIIARDSSEFLRVATVDRGTEDAIEVGDAVIAAGGALAGRVVSVGPDFANVQLVNDTASTVIGELASSGATGEVVGQLGGVLVMRNVDATETIQLGDEVLTAGIELPGGVRSPYPKGLLLGQVVDIVRDANAVVQTAYLQPAADLDKLAYVLLITDYEGGLPSADDLPIPCPDEEGEVLPPGEAPCYTPIPSGAASPSPSAP